LLIVIYLLCLGLFREHESFSYSDVFIDCMRMFDSGRYVVVFCVCRSFGIFVYSLYGVTGMVDFVSSKNEELVFFMIVNVKIHGVAQGTRPVAHVLGSEGLALITRG
jgi:hypothetical protein